MTGLRVRWLTRVTGREQIWRESQTQAGKPAKRLSGQPRRDGARLGAGGKGELK